MAAGSVELGGKVIDGGGAPKVGLTVSLYEAATWEAAGSTTATTTTDSDGLWAFSTQDITKVWLVVVTEGTKKYIIDARNELQLTNLDIITEMKVDTIYEHTSGSGVTIDGVLIKDGIVTAGGALLPALDDTHDLGSASFAWQDLFLEGDITLTDAGSLKVADNSATAFQILQGSDAYLIIDTANSSESVSIGTGISGSTVTLGHGTSTVAVADDLTVGGDVTVTGATVLNGTTTLNGSLILGDAAADTLTIGATLQGATPLIFEGANAGGDNDHETSFAITDPTADRTITFPDATLTVNAAADISGTTLASNVVTTSVTTVGALLSGSIASGFGAIDIGSDALTATGTITGPSGTWDAGGMDIASTDTYAIAGTDVLNATTLGTAVVTSSLTTVGILDAGSITGNFGTINNAAAITGTVLTATTNFTLGNTVITDGVITDSTGLSLAADVTVTGDLIVSGDTITVNTATLAVEDPLIALATGNGADSVDVGFYAKYTATGVKYSGLFRDASDSDKWKLFATTGGSHAAPTTTVNTTSGFTLGTLVASAFEGDITGDVTGNADTVTTNANLTGHITSSGNAASLGSFTSLQLKSALSDETGSGAAVFATSPTFVTPILGTPSSGVATNLTGTAASLTAGNVTTNANLTGHITSSGNATSLGAFTLAQLNTAISDATLDSGGGDLLSTSNLSDVANAGTSRTNLGVAIGSDVQAYSSVLAAVAAGTDITVAQGGTGASTFTDHGVMLGSGTAAVSVTAAGTAGYVLISGGSGSDPTWAAAVTGDITSVVAGAGMTGGATTGDATLDVIGGDGITVATDAIAVDLVASGGLEFVLGELQVATGIAEHDIAQYAASVANADFLRINGTAVEGLSAAEVAAAIESSIDAVGTIASGTWEGDTVAVAQGGTGATSLDNLIALTTHTTGNYVGTVTAGTGLTSSGATSGEGIAHSLSVDSGQTGITSMYSTSLHVGRDADNTIYFTTDNEIRFQIANVDHEIAFLAGGVGHFDGDVYAFSTTTSSDRKLKTNIQPIENALDKVLTLEGVTFDWKDAERGSSAGLIAQDVQAILPELVKEAPNMGDNTGTHLNLNYDGVVGLLVAAVIELTEKVEAK